MENQELARVETENAPLTAKEIRANVNLIQEVMKGVMVEGTHYGVVQGCGNKQTLLKPGAEKLLLTFRVGAFPEVIDLSGKDERRYRVLCHGKTIPTGALVGIGVGECSTDEEKYKWKGASCQKEFDATPEDRRRIKYLRSGEEILQVRTNPADLANTVLKMADKRAHVALALKVTGASDIFVQDVEDLEELPNGTAKEPAKEPPPMPKAKASASTEEARIMESKFDGQCKFCPDPVRKGDKIAYSKTLGTFHEACYHAMKEQAK